MPAAVPARAATARLLGRAAADQRLAMSVTLHVQHREELETLIADQQQPWSPTYHQWLTPQEFADRFGAPPDVYEEVAGWLRDHGFTVRPSASRLRLDFSGPVWRVERTFGVRMNRYRHRGRPVIANADPPAVPVRFANVVEFVRLDTFRLAEPLVRVIAPTGATFTMAPADVSVAYNIAPVLARGIDGSGQTIAVVARSDFNVADVSRFQAQFNVPLHSPVKVFPNTNPGVGAPEGVCRGIRDAFQRQQCLTGEEGEVLLDVEWAGAIATGATVLVDISGTDIDASLNDVVNNHPEAKVITISFGACERLDPGDATLFAPMYAQAAVQGQTVLVASGNNGADDCNDGKGPSVNVLATNANVTAVGGTALDPGFDASGNATGYVSERVWNDVGGASGGGASVLVVKPAYQLGPGVPADGARDVPDVSLLASPR